MEPTGVAVVTGASRGIGRATAVELARRGFDVVATMRDPDDGAGVVDAAGGLAGSLRVERLDVTDLASFAMPRGLRVLVNNAGAQITDRPVEHTPAEDERRLFETNVLGLMAVTRLALPVLRANGGGVICNLTSASLLVPVPFYAAYRASKAAVASWSESLQAEVAPHGIRVIDVLPGAIDTDMLAEDGAEMAEAGRHEAYRALAALMRRARTDAVTGATPVAVAAEAIADAVLDDAAPLRVTCDPMGAGLLEAAHGSPGDTLVRSFLDGFLVEP